MNNNLEKLHSLTENLNEKDKELREQKETYESLVELLPEIVIVHKDSIIQFINNYGLDVFGFDNKDQVIGQNIFDFIQGDDVKKTKYLIKKINGVCRQEDFMEIRLLRSDNTVFIGETGASTISWKGEPAIQTVIRDITHVKRVETELINYKLNSGQLNSIKMPPNKSYTIADGWNTKKIAYTKETDTYDVSAFRGSDLPKHFHKQKEYIEIIKGELIVFLEEDTVIIKSGESLEIEPLIAHKLTALTDVKLKVTFTPPLSVKD